MHLATLGTLEKRYIQAPPSLYKWGKYPDWKRLQVMHPVHFLTLYSHFESLYSHFVTRESFLCLCSYYASLWGDFSPFYVLFASFSGRFVSLCAHFVHLWSCFASLCKPFCMTPFVHLYKVNILFFFLFLFKCNSGTEQCFPSLSGLTLHLHVRIWLLETQIQYLTVMYHHSKSVIYIGSCKHS